MAYPPLAPNRRSRRRRWLFVALIIVIVVAVVALAVQYRTEQRAVSDYLAVAEEVANTESKAAAALDAVVASLDTVDRSELMSRLGMLATDTSEAEERLASADVPPSAAEVHGFLSVAVTSWSGALTSIRAAIVIVLDQPLDEAGFDQLTESVNLLRVGDTAYAGFLDALNRMDPDLVTRDFHSFGFIAVANSDAFDPTAMATRLQGGLQLEATRDISITGITNPEPVAFQEGTDVPVIPFSESFAVSAVVANEGNEVESAVTVSLVLTPSDGGDDGLERDQTIAELAPGAATTLVFDDIPLRGGGFYELVITAALPADDDEANNVWRMVLYQNADT